MMMWNRPVLRSDRHEPHQEHRLGTVSNTITGGLKQFCGIPTLTLGAGMVHTHHFNICRHKMIVKLFTRFTITYETFLSDQSWPVWLVSSWDLYFSHCPEPPQTYAKTFLETEPSHGPLSAIYCLLRPLSLWCLDHCPATTSRDTQDNCDPGITCILLSAPPDAGHLQSPDRF